MSPLGEEMKETIVSKILNALKAFEGKEITDLEFADLINTIYNAVDSRITELMTEKKEIQFTVEDYEDIADLAISLADIHVTSFLNRYAFDSSSLPYQIPEQRFKRLKSLYTKKIMLRDSDSKSLINELSSMLYSTMYLASFYRSQENRKKTSK